MRQLRIVALLLAAFALRLDASYPSSGYNYVQGVGPNTFISLALLQHVYNGYGGSGGTPLFGEDVAVLAEAAFARYANCRNAANYSNRAITNAVSAAQINRIADAIDKCFTNDLGHLSWIVGSMSTSSRVVSNISYVDESRSAIDYLRDIGVSFYGKLSDVVSTSQWQSVSSGDAVAKGKVLALYNALYKMKNCIVEPSSLVSPSYDYTVVVQDKGTPGSTTGYAFVDPWLSGRLAYLNMSFIAIQQTIEGEKSVPYRWHIRKKAYMPEFCTYRNYAWRCTDYDYVHLFRVQRHTMNWTTGSASDQTAYYLHFGTSPDYSQIIHECGISDNVQCPSSADLGFSFYNRGSADYTCVDCIASFLYTTMEDDYIYWNPYWNTSN